MMRRPSVMHTAAKLGHGDRCNGRVLHPLQAVLLHQLLTVLAVHAPGGNAGSSATAPSQPYSALQGRHVLHACVRMAHTNPRPPRPHALSREGRGSGPGPNPRGSAAAAQHTHSSA